MHCSNKVYGYPISPKKDFALLWMLFCTGRGRSFYLWKLIYRYGIYRSVNCFFHARPRVYQSDENNYTASV